MFIIGVITVILIIAIGLYRKMDLVEILMISGAFFTGVVIIYALAISIGANDKEVWSGYVVDWEHKEEYWEHIPAKTKRYTDSNGNRKTRRIPAKNIYHHATNRIKTSDNGWTTVNQFNGKKFNDKYPNSTEELKQMWKPKTPTASVHRYVNKVSGSQSIYESTGQYEHLYDKLPDYPMLTRENLYIDRVIGYFPNMSKMNKQLSQKNSDLNIMIPDPEKEGKQRAWKQVNMIIVNLGDGVSSDYGYALKDHWGNGNKNDFIVCLSMGNDGIIDWVNIITWSESELLKIEVRDYLLDLDPVLTGEDSINMVNKISDLVAEKFERKQFADFNYLKPNINIGFYILLIIVSITFIVFVANLK